MRAEHGPLLPLDVELRGLLQLPPLHSLPHIHDGGQRLRHHLHLQRLDEPQARIKRSDARLGVAEGGDLPQLAADPHRHDVLQFGLLRVYISGDPALLACLPFLDQPGTPSLFHILLSLLSISSIQLFTLQKLIHRLQ